jgi:hypothetical protein
VAKAARARSIDAWSDGMELNVIAADLKVRVS